MNKAKIEYYIGTVEKILNLIKEEMRSNNEQPPQTLFNEADKIEFVEKPETIVTLSEDEPKVVVAPSNALQMYFAANIINNPNWPEAVPQDLLADITSEDDMNCRAGTIIDCTIDVDMQGKTFLDFGCGDGYVAREALNRGVEKSVGYDIFISDKWESVKQGLTNLEFVDDYDELKGQKFDIILIYDVIDHCEKPLGLLVQAKKLLADDGVIYLKCHPWTSRHGTHIYKTLNRAYVHLLVKDENLKKMGHNGLKVRKLLHPIQSYREWIDRSGLVIKDEKVITNNLDKFFRDNEKTRKSIYKHWSAELEKGEISEDSINRILEIEFVEYTLTIKDA